MPHEEAKTSKVELIKEASYGLRGSIAAELVDHSTDHVEDATWTVYTLQTSSATDIEIHDPANPGSVAVHVGVASSSQNAWNFINSFA